MRSGNAAKAPPAPGATKANTDQFFLEGVACDSLQHRATCILRLDAKHERPREGERHDRVAFMGRLGQGAVCCFASTRPVANVPSQGPLVEKRFRFWRHVFFLVAERANFGHDLCPSLHRCLAHVWVDLKFGMIASAMEGTYAEPISLPRRHNNNNETYACAHGRAHWHFGKIGNVLPGNAFEASNRYVSGAVVEKEEHGGR